jgi:hypothetical protein
MRELDERAVFGLPFLHSCATPAATSFLDLDQTLSLPIPGASLKD